jgi:hypothetical protein
MAKVELRKLPPHWIYVPSRRHTRALLDRLGADVRAVVYQGTASRPVAAWLSLGFVEARVVEGAWCFYLRFWGLPEALAGPVREGLSDSALGEVERFIGACLATRPDETAKPTQLHLSFALEDGAIRSTCRAKVVDRYSYPTGDWWRDRSTV